MLSKNRAAYSHKGLLLTAPPCVMLRLAPPLAAVWQLLTLAANLSEHSVSKAEAGSGLMLTNISVLPAPPRQG